MNELDIPANLLYSPKDPDDSFDYSVLSIERHDELIPLEFEDPDVVSKNGDLIYAYGIHQLPAEFLPSH